MNFRYRYNLRVYLEQFAGRDCADIVLLPRSKERSLNSIPIIKDTACKLNDIKSKIKKSLEYIYHTFPGIGEKERR